MYEELMRQLRACMDENIPCEEANCGYAPFSKDEDCIDNLMHRAADAIEELNKEVMTLRSDYWDVTCDPEYRESHFQKDEWGKW